MTKHTPSPAAVKITGVQGSAFAKVDQFGELPILFLHNIGECGFGKPMKIRGWNTGRTTRPSKALGDWDNATASATHIVVNLGHWDQRRSYLGVFRVAGYWPPTGRRAGWITLTKHVAKAL
jgi:hypothetical protein